LFLLIVFLALVIALRSLLTAWRTGPGVGRTRAVVLAVVSGVVLMTLMGLYLLVIIVYNQAWSSG
jgi:hypothetical protein